MDPAWGCDSHIQGMVLGHVASKSTVNALSVLTERCAIRRFTPQVRASPKQNSFYPGGGWTRGTSRTSGEEGKEWEHKRVQVQGLKHQGSLLGSPWILPGWEGVPSGAPHRVLARDHPD